MMGRGKTIPQTVVSASTTGLLLAMLASALSAQEGPEVPFEMPVPDGWRTETIPFPLTFAPDLDYDGLEELRFAPGMFDPESADFWSYAFVWWIPVETPLDTARMKRDLEAYFDGLARAVAEAREFDPGDAASTVEVRRIPSPQGSAEWFAGRAEVFDAFATRDMVGLEFAMEIVGCPDQGHKAALFLLSPQPRSAAVWEQLEAIRDGFRCSRPHVEYLSSPAIESLGLPFSEAVRVGDVLYLSGQIGNLPGTFELVSGGIGPETRQTLENIQSTLERHGSSLDRVFKCTVFLADIDEWPALNEVYKTFFTNDPPARSAVAGSGLALGARVEIECLATVADG